MSLKRTNHRGQKLCLITSCPVVIPDHHLMCAPHWRSVPQPLRLKIWAALRRWLDDPGDGQKLFALQQLQAEARGLVS